jgi:hypothetical protein
VYREATESIAPTRGAGALSVVPAGELGADAVTPIAAAFRTWAEVRDELLRILTVCADRAAGAGEAVSRAISEHTGTDADGTNATNRRGPLTAAPASRYRSEMAGRAEAIKSLVIERKKDDDQAFQDYVRHRFQDYADEVTASYDEWQHAYEGWIRDRRKESDAAGAPTVSRVQQAPSATPELRAAYERHVEESAEWIVPAFQAWAEPDPDA